MAHRLNVALLAYDGVDELDLFGAFSVLSKAAEIQLSMARHPLLNVYLSGASENITGSSGLKFKVNQGLAGIDSANIVLIPGGRGAPAMTQNSEVLTALVAVLDRGEVLCGVCTGSLIIAATGRAQNSCLAIHQHKQAALKALTVGAVGSGLVHDAQMITVGGDLSLSVKSIDLAFYLLAQIAPETVMPTSERLEIRPGRIAEHYIHKAGLHHDSE